MSREEAIEIVRQMEKAVNARDTAGLLALYHDDAVTVSPMFPWTVGRTAIGKSWDIVFSLFPDWSATVSDVLVDGDRVAFFGSAGATDRSGWFGQPATGERFDYRAIIVLTIAGGKIIRDERIYDLSGLLQLLEKARTDKELQMAAELQRTLLARMKHLTAYCEAAGDSLPCRAIGGDFFELVDLPSGNFGIALGDVAGKGPASALFAALIQGMLIAEIERESRPSTVLHKLNRSLARRGFEPRFATLVYGILSPDGQFVYSNAGHNPPIVVTHNGIRRLTTGGPILGAFIDSSFEEEAAFLGDGDNLIMFSDGVTEAHDADNHEFGEDRLISCVTALGASPAQEIVGGILARVNDFSKGLSQTDDITVTATKFRRH